MAASSWRLPPHEQLLCAIMQVGDPSLQQPAAEALLRELGPSAAWALAEAHELQGHVAHALGDKAEPVWRQAHRETQRRIGCFLEELDRIADSFWREGIALVALKNAGIARALHPCPGCCPMGDLDVLVHRHDFPAAHEILLQEGYQLATRDPSEPHDLDAAELTGGAEYLRQLPSGDSLWFELQWRPVAGRWIRPDQEPDGSLLLERSHAVAGSRVRILSPADNLLQVALHTAKHSYVRAPGLRLHTDVDRIVHHTEAHGPPLNWDAFVSQVCRTRVKTAVYFSLRIPRDLLGTRIPQDVLRALQPAGWRRCEIQRRIRQAGLTGPEGRKFGRLGYLLFNLLLYDDLRGVARAAFPAREWMRRRYGAVSAGQLSYWYGRRLWDLVVRRNPT